jgi:putative component of membrane protein insertase Oxa1/YidC/SpoIIIJ protein YidD
MRYFLLLCIRIYWLVPSQARRKCLFKESCSRYVYRITKAHGFWEGVRALKKRSGQCTHGYAHYSIEGQEWVILKDQSVVERSQTLL